MRKTICLSTLLCLICIQISFTQSAPMKWGKVPTEDLQMTTYEADTTAEAVVLCDYGTFFPEEITTYRQIRHRRIKILKRSGFSYGDIAIHYPANNSLSIKAQIFSPSGEKIEVSKKDIFNEKVNDYWNVKKFSFPNVEVGSVIEYRYELGGGIRGVIGPWYFQESIPVRWSEYRIEMVNFFSYVPVFQGTENLHINDKTTGSYVYQSGSQGTDKYRMVGKEVPALKRESFVTTMDDYRMSAKYLLKNLDVPGVLYEDFMTNWENVAKSLMESTSFGEQINKKGRTKNAQEALEPLLVGVTDPNKKVQIIYDFVNDNLEWNKSYRMYSYEGLNKCFEKKKANSAELNLMLISLLKQNGIEAFPIITSTRGNGKMFQFYPILDQFNHVLTYANLDKPMILDAGNKLRPAGLIRESALNYLGLVIMSETETQWIPINPQKATDVMVVDVAVNEEGAIDAAIKCTHSGYSGVDERNRFLDDGEGKYWQERMEDNFTNVELKNFQYDNVEEIGKAFKGNMEWHLDDAAQVNGDFIYMPTNIYKSFDENPFKLEKRTFPIEIPYPFTNNFVYNIAIPEGYIVEELPQPLSVKIPDGAGSYLFSAAEKDGSIQLVSKLVIKKTQYIPTEYEGVKQFFDLMIEKQNEQIVFKKI